MSLTTGVFRDSTGSLNIAEIGGTLALLVYLGLVIAGYVQKGIIPDGLNFSAAVGGIIGTIAGAQWARGDRDLDKMKLAKELG